MYLLPRPLPLRRAIFPASKLVSRFGAVRCPLSRCPFAQDNTAGN